MHKPINCNDDGPSTVTKFNSMGIVSVYYCDRSTMNYAVTGKAQLLISSESLLTNSKFQDMLLLPMYQKHLVAITAYR